MPGDHDDAIFGTRKLRDDVAHWKFPFHRVGREGVALHLVALEMRQDVTFQFPVILAADRPRTKRGDFLRVLHGARRVDFRCRAGVCGHGGRRRRRIVGLLNRRAGLRLHFGFCRLARNGAQQSQGQHHRHRFLVPLGAAHPLACRSRRSRRCLGCTNQATPIDKT